MKTKKGMYIAVALIAVAGIGYYMYKQNQKKKVQAAADMAKAALAQNAAAGVQVASSTGALNL